MRTLCSFCAAVLLVVAAPAMAADPAATMADILVGMNHYPTDEQKSTLSDIASDEGVDEHLRTIATAISDIEHRVTDADREKLKSIAANESASETEKKLADAALAFNHELPDEEAAALQALVE